MKKKDKVTVIQIVGGQPNPEKRLKELNLHTNPEYTLTLFTAHMGGIIYLSDSKKKGDKNG